MIANSRYLERLAFVLLAVVCCTLLSLRPIPSEFSENDTGRYAAYFHESCKGVFVPDEATKTTSFEVFILATLPACLFESTAVFLFEAAFFLPLGFILFARWGEGALFWATSFLISFYGLDLMINALRQGFGMMIFFGALALIRKHSVLALFLGLVATAAHASVIVFFPFLFWVGFTDLSRKAKIWSTLLLFIVAIVWVLLYRSVILGLPLQFDELFELYREFYAENISLGFLVFACLPLYFVYGMRRVLEMGSISRMEQIGIVYSSIALGLCVFFFPFITYRIATFAVVMQIFLVMLSSRHDWRVGSAVMAGFFAHLAFFYFATSYFDISFNG